MLPSLTSVYSSVLNYKYHSLTLNKKKDKANQEDQ